MIEKEQWMDLIKPRVMESLEKMRSKLLEDMKPITRGKDTAKIYDILQVIDSDETTDEKKIFEYRFEQSRDPTNNTTPLQIMTILNDIKTMEHRTQIQVMIPIFDKIFHFLKSKYSYEKVFDYNFDRAYYSTFTVNYDDVYDKARDEAFEAIYESAYKKAVDSVFDTDVHDSVYKESLDLARKSCDPEDDENKFDELFNSIYEPLLDEKVELALDSAIKYAQNEKEYEDAFQKSVNSTFEETLISAIESTYCKMTDSIHYEELQKTYQAFLDMI